MLEGYSPGVGSLQMPELVQILAFYEGDVKPVHEHGSPTGLICPVDLAPS